MANLIFQTAFIGDALLTVPLIKQLRKYGPNAPSIVCRKSLAPLFEGLGLVDKAYSIDKKNTGDWIQLRKELNKIQWDNIYCPHQSSRSAFFLKSINSKNKISYHQWWNKAFFHQRVTRNSKLPEALRVLSLLTATNKEFSEIFYNFADNPQYHSPTERDTLTQWQKLIPPWADMQVDQDSESVNLTHKKFSIEAGNVFIAPGSVWATKRWTLNGYISVAQELEKMGYKIYITGDQADMPIAEDMMKAMPQAYNLCGKTNLLELHALFTKAKMVLSNDSSPIHMAALAGCPVVAIFGPTTLALGFRPWTSRSYVVQKNLSCRPCGKHGHQECPIGTHACMHEISSQDVMSVIRRLSL